MASMKALIYFLATYFFILAPHTIAAVNKTEGLPSPTREITFIERQIPNERWPEVTALVPLNSPPMEALAVFSHFARQSSYTPNMLKSKPLVFAADGIHVAYELSNPWPIENAKFVNSHELIVNEENDIYAISWKMLSSNLTDKSYGRARFFTKEGQTYFEYQNFVAPKSRLAGFFRSRMISDVKKTLEVIRDHIEETINQRPEELKEAVLHLRESYQKLKNKQESL